MAMTVQWSPDPDDVVALLANSAFKAVLDNASPEEVEAADALGRGICVGCDDTDGAVELHELTSHRDSFWKFSSKSPTRIDFTAYACPTGSVTAEAWVKPGNDNAINSLIVAHSNLPTDPVAFGLFTSTADKTKVTGRATDTASNAYSITSDWSVFAEDEWTHIAMVYDVGESELRLYANGQECATAVATAGNNLDASATSLDSIAGHAAGTYYYAGMTISEVRLWNDVRSQAEIRSASRARLTGREADLLRYYPLCENDMPYGTRDWSFNDDTVSPSIPNYWDFLEQELRHSQPLLPIVGYCAAMDGVDDYGDCGAHGLTGAQTREAWVRWDAGADGGTLISDWEDEGGAYSIDGITYNGSSSVTDFGTCHNDTGDQTVEIWVTTTTTTASVIYSHWDSAGQQWLFYQNADGTMSYYVKGSNGTNYSVASNSALNDGDWHCLSGSFEGSTGYVRFYVDGVEQTASPATCAVSTLTSAAAVNVVIGRYGTAPSAGWWSGTACEARIWDDLRTPTEIGDYFDQQLTGGEAGLAHYWPGTDLSGTTLTDKCASSDGTITSGTWASDAPTLDPAPSSPSADSRHRLSLSAADTWKAEVQLSDNSFLEATCSTTPTDSDWHHLAWTFDASDMKLRIYLDGVLEDTSSAGVVATLLAEPSPANDELVGKHRNGDFFAGDVTDIRVWEAARSEAEILAAMNSRLASNEDDLVAFYPFDELANQDMVSSENGDRIYWHDYAKARCDGPATRDPLLGGWIAFDAASSSRIDTGTSTMRTFGLWFRRDGNPAAGTFETIACQWAGAGGNCWRIVVKDTGQIRISVKDGAAAITTIGSATTDFCDGNWHHVALVIRNDDVWSAFFDGVKRMNQSITGTPSSTDNVSIGANTAAAYRYFTGDITEVQVWSSALDDDEITGYYQRERWGTESGLSRYYGAMGPYRVEVLDLVNIDGPNCSTSNVDLYAGDHPFATAAYPVDSGYRISEYLDVSDGVIYGGSILTAAESTEPSETDVTVTGALAYGGTWNDLGSDTWLDHDDFFDIDDPLTGFWVRYLLEVDHTAVSVLPDVYGIVEVEFAPIIHGNLSMSIDSRLTLTTASGLQKYGDTAISGSVIVEDKHQLTVVTDPVSWWYRYTEQIVVTLTYEGDTLDTATYETGLPGESFEVGGLLTTNIMGSNPWAGAWGAGVRVLVEEIYVNGVYYDVVFTCEELLLGSAVVKVLIGELYAEHQEGTLLAGARQITNEEGTMIARAWQRDMVDGTIVVQGQKRVHQEGTLVTAVQFRYHQEASLLVGVSVLGHMEGTAVVYRMIRGTVLEVEVMDSATKDKLTALGVTWS